MNTDDLEARLEGGEENQTFEVKGPMAWSHRTLARDILAMANVRDGGTILIGVADRTFERVGIDADTMKTYDPDVMRDQMARYADPHVRFSVSFPEDRDGKRYVAIEVAPFRDIPVVCGCDTEDTKAGTIYYRTTNRRPESAAVNNSYDMRDIIMTAAIRMRRQLVSLGFDGAAKDRLTEQLDEELEGL